MDKLPMCRICLVENVKMHVITNTLYQEIYQRLTMMPFETKDSRPIQACYVCCARLRNCYELRKNCLQSEELFTQMLQSSAPKLDELLESLTSKRLSVKQLVFQIDIGPEVRASSDSEGDMECTESIQVKIESEHVEDVVDVDECTAEKRSYTNELPNEEDPLSTTKDTMMMKHDKDDVSELQAVHRIDVPDNKPVTLTKDTTSSSTISRSSPAIVQQPSRPQALSSSERTCIGSGFIPPSTTASVTLEPTDSLKIILLKRKLDTLVKATTFASERHAIEMDILRIQNERETEKLKQIMIRKQFEQMYSEVRANKMRRLND